jgi:excinuclease UvrABC nuclease subunit
MALDDLLNDQDLLKAHTHDMRLWPRQWLAYPNRFTCTWNQSQLIPANQVSIPPSPGVYTLVIRSGVAGHPFGNYLMYVGKTKSLQRRFGEYLTSERREDGRPKILRLLNRYDPHIWFIYTTTNLNDITTLEDDLTEAFLPPYNDRFPASIRAVVGAF